MAPTPRPPREDDPYYDPARVIEIEIEMDPEDWEELAEQARSFYELLAGEDCQEEPPEDPYTWFPADVTIEGTRLEDVGIRKKGFFGSSSTTKPGLKLEFDEYVKDQEFAGMERMTLNNGSQDPSLIHQCMTYLTFGLAGQRVPRCTFAHVTVNGDDLGVYINIEPYGKDWLRQHFPDEDGDLYEGAISDFREGWYKTFEGKTGDTDKELGPIIDVVRAAELPDDEMIETLEPLIDLDNFVTHWVLETLVGHWDSYTGGTNNFYVYRDPELEKMYFLPWGTDDSFVSATSTGQATSVYVGSILPWRLYHMPDWRAVYVDRMTEVLDTAWDEALLLAEVDRLEALILPYYTDPEVIAEITAGIDVVRTYIETRRGVLEPILAAGGEDTTYELYDSWCIPASGEISATFEARWTNPLRGDPLTSGDASADITWKGDELDLSEGGAIAGPDDDQHPLIVIGIPQSDTVWYRINLRLPEDWLKPGTYEIDSNGTATATIDKVDTRIPQPPWAVIFNGWLTLEQASGSQGATIKGTFTGELFPVAEEEDDDGDGDDRTRTTP